MVSREKQLLELIEQADRLQRDHQRAREALHRGIHSSALELFKETQTNVQKLQSEWCEVHAEVCPPTSPCRDAQRTQLQHEAQQAQHAHDTAQQALDDALQQQRALQAEVDALRTDVKDALAYRAAFKTEHAKHQRTKQKLAALVAQQPTRGDSMQAVTQHNTLLRDELQRCQQQCKVCNEMQSR